MVNVGPTSSPEAVMTAASPGIHVFCAVVDSLEDPGAAALFINGDEAPKTDSGEHQRSWLCYLNTSDEVTYTGPAASIAGVRLGDEL